MRIIKLQKCPRVHGLHFTPDGGRLLVVGGVEAFGADFMFWLDPATGAETARREFGDFGPAAVAADCSRVAVGLELYDSRRLPRLLRAAALSPDAAPELRPLPLVTRWPRGGAPVMVTGLAFGPGGRLAVGVGVRDLRAGTTDYGWEYRVAVYPPGGATPPAEWPADAPFGTFAFAADDARLAASGGPEGDSAVRVFALPTTGGAAYRFDPPGARTRCLAFLPDGRLAVANARNVYVLHPGGGAAQFTLDGHAGQVNAVAVSSDGCRILTASHDGMVRVWDAATGRRTAAFDWAVGPVTALAFAPDGLTCAAAGKGKVVLWDVE